MRETWPVEAMTIQTLLTSLSIPTHLCVYLLMMEWLTVQALESDLVFNFHMSALDLGKNDLSAKCFSFLACKEHLYWQAQYASHQVVTIHLAVCDRA